ncbi:MAG: LCP family protein [Clostridia bacterium]|nr:LCP family protein [Clostridia bacterium]
MKRRRDQKPAVVVLLAAVITALLLTAVLWHREPDITPETRGEYTGPYTRRDTITVNGRQYAQRGRLDTLLMLGIDQSGNVTSADHRSGGQADFLRLLVVDHEQKRVTQIELDRDTVVPITVLSVTGVRRGTREAQICLAHAFGDGKLESNALTAEAVSRLLNVPIRNTLSVNLDSIPVINDFVGGVTVTVEDDLTAADPTLTPGAVVTLTGKQAEAFVRSRRGVGDGSNPQRMKRQQVYISGLMTRLKARMDENQNTIPQLTEALGSSLCTDISRGRLTNDAWVARDYEQVYVTIPGTSAVKNGFRVFYCDEQALAQLVLDVFYKPID